jgi:TatA/E family protein of Tat protein translocase
MKPYLLAFGTNEMIIIVIVVLLLFGGRKIPELMRGLGKGVREFNDAKSNDHIPRVLVNSKAIIIVCIRFRQGVSCPVTGG